MGQLVQPQTFLIGYTTIDKSGLLAYLQATGNEGFIASLTAAKAQGISDGEVLCSFYAKLCYASLVLGKNANVQRVRDIPDNIKACLAVAHGAVFGHCNLNLVTTSCSRILTHELIRNHIGTEYSQTSGRYCRLESIDLVWDPILDPVRDLFIKELTSIEATVYLAECRLGLRKPNPERPHAPPEAWLELYPVELLASKHGGSLAESDALRWLPDYTFDFTRRKQLTSAIRRIAPNGQSNEIGWSINLRALRHVVQMRTSRHAEREMRLVFNQVYHLIKAKFPLIFSDAKEIEVAGLLEISGMRTQPYAPTEAEVLRAVPLGLLQAELQRRATTTV